MRPYYVLFVMLLTACSSTVPFRESLLVCHNDDSGLRSVQHGFVVIEAKNTQSASLSCTPDVQTSSLDKVVGKDSIVYVFSIESQDVGTHLCTLTVVEQNGSQKYSDYVLAIEEGNQSYQPTLKVKRDWCPMQTNNNT